MPPHQRVGRYLLYDAIAAGGMASVYLGKLVSQIGVGRIVAVKSLHPLYAEDPAFVDMLVDEASLSLRLQHPNIVPTLDVVTQDGKLFIVMEYVHGASVGGLWKKSHQRGEHVPIPIAARILFNALEGLHAAHEACSPKGEPLHIVHRDVSPQNIMVGVDGISRVLDFGIAKAAGRVQNTQDGQVKGKLSYMSPEQVRGQALDRRVDVFAAGVILWELLTGTRLLEGDGVGGIIGAVLFKDIPRPSTINPAVPIELDAITLRALSKEPEMRFSSARAMAEAIENATPLAADRVVSAFVKDLFGGELKERAALISAIESETLAGKPDLQSEPAPGPRVASAPLPRPSGILPESSQLTPPLISIEAAGREIVRRSTIAGVETQAGSADDSSPGIPEAPRSLRKIVAIAGIGAAVFLSVGIGVVVGWRPSAAPATASPSAAASTPAASGTAVPSSPTIAAAAQEPSAQPPAASAAPSTSAPATQRLPAGAPPPPPLKAQPVKTPTPAQGGCNPPWRVDERGVRVPKPNCI